MIMDVIVLELPLLAFIMLFGVIYGVFSQKWSIIESMYFVVITFSTVGFGDYAPTESWSRLLAVIVVPFAVAIFCEMLGRIASAYIRFRIDRDEEEFLERQFTMTDLKLMDTNDDGEICYGEFLSFILTAMQKISKEDMQQLKETFDALDTDKNGKLTKEDVRQSINQNYHVTRSGMLFSSCASLDSTDSFNTDHSSPLAQITNNSSIRISRKNNTRENNFSSSSWVPSSSFDEDDDLGWDHRSRDDNIDDDDALYQHRLYTNFLGKNVIEEEREPLR